MLANSTIFQCTFPTGYPQTSGLNVIVSAGAISISGTLVIIPAKRFPVAPISTTYIYVDMSAGIITSNTSGFATSGIYPVAIAITNLTQITTLQDARPDVFATGAGGGAGAPDSTQQVSVSSTVSFLGSNNTLVDATAGAGGITLTLPDAAASTGQIIRVTMIDTGVGGVLLQPVGGQLINDMSNVLLTNQWQYAQIESNGSNWRIIAAN